MTDEKPQIDDTQNSSPAEHTSEPMSKEEEAILFDRVVEQLKLVHDPEIPVNIYDLGLIYQINIMPVGDVEIDMTLTSPNCPVAEDLPLQVKEAAECAQGVRSATVRIVWDPPWDRTRMSDDALMMLGFY